MHYNSYIWTKSRRKPPFHTDAPGSGTLAQVPPPLFETEENVVLTFTLEEVGNPPARYRWTRNGDEITTTAEPQYALGPLSAAEHDGLWGCTPYNSVGDGSGNTVRISIKGKCKTLLCIACCIWLFVDASRLTK